MPHQNDRAMALLLAELDDKKYGNILKDYTLKREGQDALPQRFEQGSGIYRALHRQTGEEYLIRASAFDTGDPKEKERLERIEKGAVLPGALFYACPFVLEILGQETIQVPAWAREPVGAGEAAAVVMQLLRPCSGIAKVNDEGDVVLACGALRDEEEVLVLGLQLSLALAAADSAGVRLGRIDPLNIYFTENKAAKEQGAGAAALTYKLGGFVNAPDDSEKMPQKWNERFMSPEGQGGEKITAKSEIFSLGKVLQALLSGSDLLHSDRRWMRVPSHDASPVTNKVVSKMISPAPDKRYADFGEVFTALSGALKAFIKSKYENETFGAGPTKHAVSRNPRRVAESEMPGLKGEWFWGVADIYADDDELRFRADFYDALRIMRAHLINTEWTGIMESIFQSGPGSKEFCVRQYSVNGGEKSEERLFIFRDGSLTDITGKDIS